MGIESLNSAAAAAGFAMVSDEVGDEASTAYDISFSKPPAVVQPVAAPAPVQSYLPAIVDTAGRGAATGAALIGARVSGLLDSWRAKG